MFTRREFLATATVATTSFLQPRFAWGKTEEIPATGIHNPNLASFDNLFTKFLKENALPGVGVAVTHQGKLVYARGFGYADVENKKPVEPNSQFRLASVSKPITATGIFHLLDKGKLKLDDPVLKYIKLPAFIHPNIKPDARWEKITIHQCLRHTAGWDRDRKGGFDPIGIPWDIMKAMKLNHHPTPDDIVRYMMGLHLDFNPGAKMVYSNLGYLVLGRVIEEVTGEKYEPWMKKNILAPIHAASIVLGRALPEHRPPTEVKYYDSKKRKGACLYPPRMGEQVPLPNGGENQEGFEAHGGWIASPVDLVRFASAFDYDRKSPLLSDDSIKEMWARPPGPAGFGPGKKKKDAYYGCGWDVRPIGNTGKANTWHNGLIAGSSTMLVRRFDGLNWAVLFNTDANHKAEEPAGEIDEPMHEAADAVKRWPDVDLFEKFPRNK
ncbi:MAG TPA: serine hydrolase domain-containing protein [Gemmata sp.]|nr:serine hydrolase domain-containing protein [Gemmata sp.]